MSLKYMLVGRKGIWERREEKVKERDEHKKKRERERERVRERGGGGEGCMGLGGCM